ncbi:hypothetical protein [Oxynema aestuarii]|uniref:Uncharacterized protein n=1 Tax=Oxynema aestuarii AP17 TaxID=2064643 RepID=A0A6H1TWS3_9CYAN|nr:hypothetical protein [Oxynema aestuarii]QIZ71052.1 hypothetical protein HCG48_11000 [Oxynema aestuarii AP17]
MARNTSFILARSPSFSVQEYGEFGVIPSREPPVQRRQRTRQARIVPIHPLHHPISSIRPLPRTPRHPYSGMKLRWRQYRLDWQQR